MAPEASQFRFLFDYIELNVKVNQGNINGLLIKAKEKSLTKGLIIYFHGNKGDLNKWAPVAQDLTKHHYDVLVFDYRGYGKSRGDRSESNLYSDSMAIRDYVISEFDYKSLVFFGRSIGSAMAIDLAMKCPPDKLILETPFARLSDAIPVLKKVLLYRMITKYRFESIEKAKYISCPVLILHGTADRLTPLKSAKSLFEAFKSENKKIITLYNGGHNNLDNFEGYSHSIEDMLA